MLQFCGLSVPETFGVSSDSLSVDRVMRLPCNSSSGGAGPTVSRMCTGDTVPPAWHILSVNRLTGRSEVARPSCDRLQCRAWR